MKKEKQESDRPLVIGILLIVAFFGIFLLTRLLYNPDPLTISEMHERTLQGKESESNYLYNGFSFVESDGLWYTRIQGNNLLYNIPLHYGPRQLEDIEIQGDVRRFILDVAEVYDGKAYITFNPLGNEFTGIALANGEFSVNVVKTFNMNIVAACTVNETSACNDVPIVTCEDEDKAVIFFREDDEAGVFVEDNCLIFQGRGKDFVRMVDRVLLNWYDVLI